MKMAARPNDNVVHPLSPILGPGPGSINVFIGGLPAWRGIPAAAVGALQAPRRQKRPNRLSKRWKAR
jgi:hypothetical protein